MIRPDFYYSTDADAFQAFHYWEPAQDALDCLQNPPFVPDSELCDVMATLARSGSNGTSTSPHLNVGLQLGVVGMALAQIQLSVELDARLSEHMAMPALMMP